MSATNEDKKPNTAAIVVGILIIVAIVGGIVWFVYYRKRQAGRYLPYPGQAPSTYQAVTGQYSHYGSGRRGRR